MGEAFSELVRAESLIVETLKLEETKFKETLGRGLRQLEDAAGKLSEGMKLPGEVAFKLYDTYGFPLDLTQDIMRGQGRTVEVAEFQNAMDAQKAAARASWSGSGPTPDAFFSDGQHCQYRHGTQNEGKEGRDARGNPPLLSLPVRWRQGVLFSVPPRLVLWAALPEEALEAAQ